MVGFPHQGAPEYLGRVFCQPTVVVPSSEYQPLPLQWYQLSLGNDKQGINETEYSTFTTQSLILNYFIYYF